MLYTVYTELYILSLNHYFVADSNKCTVPVGRSKERLPPGLKVMGSETVSLGILIESIVAIKFPR